MDSRAPSDEKNVGDKAEGARLFTDSPRCIACFRRLYEVGGYLGTGMCGPCYVGEDYMIDGL